MFEIAHSGNGYGPVTTLANFTGSDGATPFAGLIADANGDLFGTTGNGGQSGDGTVFEIAHIGNGYGPVTTLASFDGSNGESPFADLIADANGDLFGTTEQGGQNGDGTVFEIAHSGNSYGPVTTLASFAGSNGAFPLSGLIADANGDLFGTTEQGGQSGDGTVFEIAHGANGYSPVTTLESFNGNNNALPIAGLIADANGDLFGTTENGGQGNGGSVFEITNSGFVAPLQTLHVGSSGNDTIAGGSGSSVIVGFGGGDTLSAGTGATTFVETAIGDSQPGAGHFDTISGFRSGIDTLDFSFSNPPNELFAWNHAPFGQITSLTNEVATNTAPATVAANTIEVVNSGGNATVYANASGAAESVGSTDMEIHLLGVTLNASDIHHF